MEHVEVKDRESSIVLVGDFDPLLMAPHWFVKQGMLPQEDIDESLSIELVYKDITKFSVAGIVVEVRADMLILRSEQVSFDYMLHDLALGVITSVKHANITAVGLNVFDDIVISDDKLWHKFGDVLAPKEIWNVAVPNSGRAGLVNMQMQLRKPVGEPGVYNFTVQLTDRANGMRLSLNHHFDNDKFKGVEHFSYKKKSGLDALAVVSACWQETLDCHRNAIDSLLLQVARES
jgi:hypothetical protein